MTIHRAKGLEFEVVCVADLGRGPRWRAELIRVGRDGRFGLRLAEPGTGRRESALDYKALGDERFAAEAREERRLFYVAMTRARERLILSGAAKLDAWPALENGGGGGPIAWIGPAVEQRDGRRGDVRAARGRAGAGGVAGSRDGRRSAPSRVRRPAGAAGPRMRAAPPVSALSYSSLADYRALRLPLLRRARAAAAGAPGAGRRRARRAATAPARLSALDRGTLVHALLERLDFRRPRAPDRGDDRAGRRALGAAGRRRRREDAAQVAELVERFAAGELCRRLGRATAVRREARFRFLLGGSPATRADRRRVRRDRARARRPDARRRLQDRPARRRRPAGARRRLLRDPAPRVRAGRAPRRRDRGRGRPHVPRAPAAARGGDVHARAGAGARGRSWRRSRAACSSASSRSPTRRTARVCDGCPAEGGLCSWPLEMTRREAADRLF